MFLFYLFLQYAMVAYIIPRKLSELYLNTMYMEDAKVIQSETNTTYM